MLRVCKPLTREGSWFPAAPPPGDPSRTAPALGCPVLGRGTLKTRAGARSCHSPTEQTLLWRPQRGRGSSVTYCISSALKLHHGNGTDFPMEKERGCRILPSPLQTAGGSPSPGLSPKRTFPIRTIATRSLFGTTLRDSDPGHRHRAAPRGRGTCGRWVPQPTPPPREGRALLHRALPALGTSPWLSPPGRHRHCP